MKIIAYSTKMPPKLVTYESIGFPAGPPEICILVAEKLFNRYDVRRLMQDMAQRGTAGALVEWGGAHLALLLSESDRKRRRLRYNAHRMREYYRTTPRTADENVTCPKTTL